MRSRSGRLRLIGFAGGDTNLYRYVGNNATNLVDPSGENPLLIPIVKDVIIPVGIGVTIYLLDKQRQRNTGNQNKDDQFRNPPPFPNDPPDSQNRQNTGNTAPQPDFSPNDRGNSQDPDLPTNTGGSCPANLFIPFFQTSTPPWRGTPNILDGDLKKGWIHIDARHVTGNHPTQGAGDLFPPGTTRNHLEQAANEIVKKGTRISDPSRRIQNFEDRIKIKGKRDRVRVTVDTNTGEVITIFPVRSE